MDSTAVYIADKVDNLFRDLASKIGTTTEQLWPLYVEYVRVSSLVSFIGAWFIVVVAGVLCWICVKNAKKQFELDDDLAAMFTAFSIVLGLIMVVVMAISLSDVTGMIAPEAKALMELVDKIK